VGVLPLTIQKRLEKVARVKLDLLIALQQDLQEVITEIRVQEESTAEIRVQLEALEVSLQQKVAAEITLQEEKQQEVTTAVVLPVLLREVVVAVAHRALQLEAIADVHQALLPEVAAAEDLRVLRQEAVEAVLPLSLQVEVLPEEEEVNNKNRTFFGRI